MLLEPIYRKDYEGEIITDGRKSPPLKIFAKPKKLYYKENNKGKAIVIGNGVSRQHPIFETITKANNKRPMPGYKLTYACNGAMWNIDADYYVINNRALMGHTRDKRLWTQFFVPYDMFIDYKRCHMIPHISNMNAGSTALFLACFDGHDEIYMFGFDGQQDPQINNNVYVDKPCYDTLETTVDDEGWHSSMYSIMRTYSHVKFYRVGGGKQYAGLNKLSNFKDVDYSSVAVLGDF